MGQRESDTYSRKRMDMMNGARTEGTEDIVRRLDTEFDQLLADMKPHVLRLPHKSGIQSI